MSGFKNGVLCGKNADFTRVDSPTSQSGESNGLITNGQLWIGSTATNVGGTHINVGSLISPDSSITFSYTSPNITAIANAAGGLLHTLTGNSGVATVSAGNINVVTANSTVRFVGSGATLTEDFGLSNLLIGTTGPSITSGNNNCSLGNLALNGITSGSANVAVGENCGRVITTASNNNGFGTATLRNATSSAGNSGFGHNSLNQLTTGSGGNTAYGFQSLNQLATGANNTCIGTTAGTNYTTTESGNICIGQGVNGTIGESNITRIGANQTTCYITGTLVTDKGRIRAITTPGAYPYTTLNADDVIKVDTSSARTINLLATPETGRQYVIKDTVGSASANNITVSGNGKNIDGAATYPIASNYGSITVIYNGTEWSVI